MAVFVDDADLPVLHALAVAPATTTSPEGGRGEAPPPPTPIPSPGSHYVVDDAPQDTTHLAVVPPPTALTTKTRRRSLAAAKHVEYVQFLDRKLRSQSTRIMNAAMRAPEVAASGPPPDMTATEVRVARDAMIPEKDAPAYLRMANRLVDSYKRAEVLSERDPAPRLNVETIQVAVSNVYNYPVIEAPEDKR